MVREVKENELNELLGLYLFLHETSVPEMTENLKNTWNIIMEDKNHHIIVKEIDGARITKLEIIKKAKEQADEEVKN